MRPSVRCGCSASRRSSPDTPGSLRTPPPTLGEHTDAVLSRDLGYSADTIAGLRRQNVI